MTQQALYAHFYRRKGGGWEVSITKSLNPLEAIHVEAVAGKRDARKVAARFNATCWNF